LDANGDGVIDDCVTGPPVNTELPAITGTATIGSTLSGSPGAWKGYPLPAFTRQWRRCDADGGGCVDIPGATSDSYTLVAADGGHAIRLRVSGTSSLGSAAADSPQTAVVPVLLQTLTVATYGDGAGTVTSSPAGIACGATCSHDYPNGTIVTLSAAPASNSTFAGWSGGGCAGTAACPVTMSKAATVTATFDKDCAVPNVKGKRLAVAARAIKAHDCRLGRVKRAHSHTVKKGAVISQKPKPRKRLPHGAKVNLVVSKG
jgi:PASTA domain/Divergent InlB B-repeat domain